LCARVQLDDVVCNVTRVLDGYLGSDMVPASAGCRQREDAVPEVGVVEVVAVWDPWVAPGVDILHVGAELVAVLMDRVQWRCGVEFDFSLGQ